LKIWQKDNQSQQFADVDYFAFHIVNFFKQIWIKCANVPTKKNKIIG